MRGFGFRVLPVVATAAGVLAASFPTTPPDDPRYAPDVCPPATDCAGPTGQWNLLSFNDHVPIEPATFTTLSSSQRISGPEH